MIRLSKNCGERLPYGQNRPLWQTAINNVRAWGGRLWILHVSGCNPADGLFALTNTDNAVQWTFEHSNGDVGGNLRGQRFWYSAASQAKLRDGAVKSLPRTTAHRNGGLTVRNRCIAPDDDRHTRDSINA